MIKIINIINNSKPYPNWTKPNINARKHPKKAPIYGIKEIRPTNKPKMNPNSSDKKFNVIE